MAVKRYDGSQWVTVAGKGDQGTSSSISTWVKTASGGETSLSGNDDNSQALSYTVGQELVFINGTLLKRGSDYTATNGTSITGLTALAANDVATVWTVNAFSVTNAISNTLVTTTGDLIYASSANTPARLGIGSTDQVLKVSGGLPVWGAASAPAFVGCSLYSTTAQTISNATATAITFNSEHFDTDAFHSTSTNTSRITIPTGKGGYYLFLAFAEWSSSADGRRYFLLKKNGSGGVEFETLANPSTASPTGLFYYIQSAVAGDYFEIFCEQSSGGNLNVAFQNNVGAFQAYFLGA
jgi:hypothetical protein